MCSRILKGRFEKTDSNTKGNAGAPQRAFVVGYRPWVALQLLEHVCDLKLRLLDGEEESCRSAEWRASRLLRHVRHIRTDSRGEPKHFLHLLCVVVLAAPEDVGFGALGVSELVNLCLKKGQQPDWIEAVSSV
jgi:hypothetical protein